MSSNSLDHITIKGFKSIDSIERLALQQINVVIGANGSGKSNFIGAFAFLHAVGEGRLRNYVAEAGGAEKVLHFGSKITREIYFDLALTAGRCELKLRPTADDNLYVYEGETWPGGGQRHSSGVAETGEQIAQWDRDWKKALNELFWGVYHFNDTSFSSLMRKTAKIDDNRFLRIDGSNLPAFLYFLKVRCPDSYRLIVRAVQLAAPFLDDFLLEPSQLAPADIKLKWRHKRSSQDFDASSFSDGTLRFIALATLFLQPVKYRPSVILLDEPELGLHPVAIELLAALVRQASIDTQVILTTQSPYLLDNFDPQDVIVADRVDDATQLRRLEPSQLTEWLKDYSLGQLWEKNELGGRPVPA